MFTSKFPLLEAYMNEVSLLDLAVAIKKAGAYPSLFLKGSVEDKRATLEQYHQSQGDCNLVTAIGYNQIADPNLIRLFNEYKVSHAEIFRQEKEDGRRVPFDEFFSKTNIILALKQLRKTTKLLFRIYEPLDNPHELVDGICIKGEESAGNKGTLPTKEFFLKQKKLTPHHPIIVYGGISTPEQVKWYIDNGASALGIGSMFACCTESPVSDKTKMKIISSSSKDLKISQMYQNFLQMSESLEKEKNWNRSDQLQKGVHGDGQTGFIYMGTSIDKIHSVQPVQKVVDHLTSLL